MRRQNKFWGLRFLELGAMKSFMFCWMSCMQRLHTRSYSVQCISTLRLRNISLPSCPNWNLLRERPSAQEKRTCQIPFWFLERRGEGAHEGGWSQQRDFNEGKRSAV